MRNKNIDLPFNHSFLEYEFMIKDLKVIKDDKTITFNELRTTNKIYYNKLMNSIMDGMNKKLKDTGSSASWFGYYPVDTALEDHINDDNNKNAKKVDDNKVDTETNKIENDETEKIFKEKIKSLMIKFNISDFENIIIHGSDEEKNELLHTICNKLFGEINDKTEFKNKFDEFRELIKKNIELMCNKLESQINIPNIDTDNILNFESVLDKIYNKIYTDKFTLLDNENPTIEFICVDISKFNLIL